MKAVWLTTKDNPYDYFEDFDHWFSYDLYHGYNTCGYIMRVANDCSELPSNMRRDEFERACDEILKFDFENKYKKIEKEVDEDYFDT